MVPAMPVGDPRRTSKAYLPFFKENKRCTFWQTQPKRQTLMTGRTTKCSTKMRNLHRATAAVLAVVAVAAQPVGATLSTAALGTKTIQQNNPFASCTGKPKTNTLTASLQLESGFDLAGSDSSAITISGLTGAIVQGGSVPVYMADTCPGPASMGIAGPNKCIWVTPAQKSWDDAEAACIASGGHLASFSNQPEEMVAMRLERDNPLGPRLWGVPVWIGFSKEPHSPWAWSDGSPSNYLNWRRDHPIINLSGRTCTASINGQWITANCSQPFSSFCSKSLDAPAPLFCAGSTPGLGKWDGDSLTLSLCANAVIENDSTPITIKFNVTNPPHAQSSPDVSIAISGTFSIPPTAMDKPGPAGSAASIPGAADPMMILDRCSACPAGFFLDGTQGCKSCAPGTWSDQVDAQICQPCPPGSNSSAASTSVAACVCSRGHMSDDGSPAHCMFCESNTLLTGSTGELTDGSGADDYLPGTLCVWTIVSNSTWKVALLFDYFDSRQDDMVIVSECPNPTCSTPQPLATFSGPYLPGPHRRIPFPPPRPPPGPPPPPPPGQPLESSTGILQIMFRASPAPPDPPRPGVGSCGGFRARWYTPDASLQSASIYRIDSARPCPGPQQRAEQRGGHRRSSGNGTAAAWGQSRESGGRDARMVSKHARRSSQSSDPRLEQRGAMSMSTAVSDGMARAVLVVRLALDSRKAAVEAPLAITVRGVGGAGALESRRPAITVERGDGDADPCVGRKCFRVLGSGRGAGNPNPQPATWAEAEQQCQREFGGHLASIESEEENDLVFWLMSNANPAAYAWIGYHVDAKTKDYVWTDNSSSAFQNWLPEDTTALPQQLFPQSGDCSSMWTQPVADSRWRRTPCSIQLPNMICSRHTPVDAHEQGMFCSGSQRDVGEWDPRTGGGTLTLRLCPGRALVSGVVYLLSTNVSYSTSPAVVPPMNISVSGSVNVSAMQMEKLVDIGCATCPSMGYRRFGGECSQACLVLTDPKIVNVYCKSCPTGSQTRLNPSAQNDIRSCSCAPGFRLDNANHDQTTAAQCKICPTGSYCPGQGPMSKCPGNTSTPIPGQFDPARCGCGAGYSRVARPPPDASVTDVCGECPANSYCQAGSATPCPYQATSPPGAVLIQDCVFCRPVTVENRFSGTISTNIQQSSITQSCSWIMRPPGVSRVVVTVTNMQLQILTPSPSDAGLSGGMYMDLRECTDQDCQQSRLLQRFNQSLPNPQLTSLRVNSSTGVMQLVFGHIASALPPNPYNPGPEQPYPILSTGSGLFNAEWFSEPSLQSSTISQSNPFASCPNNSSMLQSNLLMLRLNLRSSIPLSGAQRSSLTISGLRGAVKPSSGVPVEVTAVIDGCIDGGGVRVDGSEKCFKAFLDGSPLTPTDARQECQRWGGELACIENDAEDNFLTNLVQQAAQAPVAPRQLPWIGYRTTNVGGTCASSYARWQRVVPNGTPNVDYCTALFPDGSWVPESCAGQSSWICSKVMPQEHQVETPFCEGSKVGWADFDAREADGTLRLNVCADKALHGYTTYVIAFTVWNPSADQESPPISLSVAGSFAIPQIALDKPGAWAGDTSQPLKIVGGSPASVCHFPDDGNDPGHKPSTHSGGWSAISILGLVLLVLLSLAALLVQWKPCREFVATAAEKVGIKLPQWEWPGLTELPGGLPGRCWFRLPTLRLPRPTSSWYRRFTGETEQEFETIADRGVI